MAYESSDPRSQLTRAAVPAGSGANVAPQFFEFGVGNFAKVAPDESTAAGSRRWWVRSQAAILCFAELAASDTFMIVDQPDEFMVLVTEPEAGVRLTSDLDHAEAEARGRALVVMPPGTSSITADRATTVVCLFSSQNESLQSRCSNASFYAEPDPNVAPWQSWPAPVDGYRIRVYDVDAVAPDPARFGRLYRCSTGMVNWFYQDPGPRDPSRLSPHHHDDFEQLSLQLAGEYVHHIRTPWTLDMANWRDDQHGHCVSPSVTVIPPPSIHTSQGVGDTPHQLLDLFCPPRHDFSARPGWVINADEYPAPEPSTPN